MRTLAVFTIVGGLALPASALDLNWMRNRKAPTPPSTNTTAKNLAEPHGFYAGFSLYSKSVMKTTSQSSGAKDLISPFQYPLSLIYSYRVSENVRLVPQLDYTIFPKTDSDGATKETNLLLRLPVAISFAQWDLEWRGGLVYHMTKLEGQGGTTTLRNGNSTQDFGLPNRTQAASTLKLDVGVQYEMDSFLFQFDILAEAPFHSTKRNFSILTGITYKIGSF